MQFVVGLNKKLKITPAPDILVTIPCDNSPRVMLCSVSAPERKRIKSLGIMLIDGAVVHDIYPKRNCVWLILLLQNKFKSLKYFVCKHLGCGVGGTECNHTHCITISIYFCNRLN